MKPALNEIKILISFRVSDASGTFGIQRIRSWQQHEVDLGPLKCPEIPCAAKVKASGARMFVPRGSTNIRYDSGCQKIQTDFFDNLKVKGPVASFASCSTPIMKPRRKTHNYGVSGRGVSLIRRHNCIFAQTCDSPLTE